MAVFVIGVPAVATAAWEDVEQPAAGLQGATEGVYGFAASGGTWLAVVSYNGDRIVRRSVNGGATWETIEYPPLPGDGHFGALGISVGPDGAFYLLVSRWGQDRQQMASLALLRLASNAVEFSALPLALPIALSDNSPPAFAGGEVWFAASPVPTYSASGTPLYGLRLYRIARDGQLTEFVPPPGGTFARGAAISALGGDIFVSTYNPAADLRQYASVFRLEGASLVPAGVKRFPFWRSGEVVVATSLGVSTDSGKTITTAQGSAPIPNKAVDGNNDLFVRQIPRYDANGEQVFGETADVILSRWGRSGHYYSTGVEVSDAATAVWQTDRGLMAVSDRSRGRVSANVLKLYRRALPGLPAGTFSGSSPGARMVARANRYRLQVGLPPLVEDPLISRAAQNHARYAKRNARQLGPSALDAHSEKPGLPGFTGEGPPDRCIAVGTTCDGENMWLFKQPPTAAVDGWMETVYHRESYIDPEFLYAGGSDDGWTTMDLRLVPVFSIAGVGYPVGEYAGRLDFAKGREIPDPLAGCDVPDQVSIPVSYLPSDVEYRRDKLVVVRVHDDKVFQNVCPESGAFFAGRPFEPGTIYEVRRFDIEDGPLLTASWRFRTAGFGPDRPCHVHIHKRRHVHKRVRYVFRHGRRVRVVKRFIHVHKKRHCHET